MVYEGEVGWRLIISRVLRIQGKKLHNDLHIDNPSDFVASKGWAPHFQCRHGISHVKINGEVRSVDTTTAHKLITHQQNLFSYLF